MTLTKDKEAILTICVGLLVLYALTKKQHDMLLYISIILGLIGMFSGYLTSKIAWGVDETC